MAPHTDLVITKLMMEGRRQALQGAYRSQRPATRRTEAAPWPATGRVTSFFGSRVALRSVGGGRP